MTISRPVIAGMSWMVSSGHYLASVAAHDVLSAGGNAVDAGCAAGIALGVVQPDIVNVAGVAPIMIRMAETGEIVTIAGLGHWPRSLPDGHFMSAHGGQIPAGVQRSVVPAAPDAWITALTRYGTMSFADVAAAAMRYADEGFAVYPLLAGSLAEHEAEYRRWPTSRDIFLPAGKVPAVGERFRQADLAASLRYMADEERAVGGSREDGLEAARGAFYAGDIAVRIADFYRAEGGFLDRDDLRDFRSRIEPAVTRRFRDIDVSVCGPWCQGPVILQTLKLLEDRDLGSLPHNSAPMIHEIVEALKCAFADREHHYGDPAFVDVPLDHLLSDAHAADRRALIDPHGAMANMPPAAQSLSPPAVSSSLDPAIEPDTSYVAVVDRDGNAFSATPSDGSWSVPVVPGTGLVASSRGSQSRPDPAHPSGARAGKRPRLTPNPAIAVRGGEVMPFGSPGGDVQPQAMLQVFLNRYVYGMDIQSAIDAPRFATYSFPSSFAPFTHHPGLLKLESRIPASTRAELEALGHRIGEWPKTTWLAGGVCAVAHDPVSGIREGGADPRRPSYAIGR